jgi:hypothetical protein
VGWGQLELRPSETGDRTYVVVERHTKLLRQGEPPLLADGKRKDELAGSHLKEAIAVPYVFHVWPRYHVRPLCGRPGWGRARRRALRAVGAGC